jgi:TIR domain/Phage integrase family
VRKISFIQHNKRDIRLELEEIYHLNIEDFDSLMWGLQHLEPFTGDNGRPPMSARDFVILFKLMYESRLRISEALNLEKQDFDLEHGTLRIRDPKVMRYGEPTILPKNVVWLKEFLTNYHDKEKIFPITSTIVEQYAKDAARLAGIQILEEQEDEGKVFISYSFDDKDIMEKIILSLNIRNIEYYTAEHDTQYGKPLTAKIQNAIKDSDALIAVITKDHSSSSVDQEVGFALNAGIQVIPFVEDGAKVGFMLNDIEQMRFKRDKIEDASDKIAMYIVEELKHRKPSEEIFINDHIIVNEHDDVVYSSNFEKDDVIRGNIESDLPITIYVVDNQNLEKYNENEECDYEIEVEEVDNYSMNFLIPKTRVWNVIIVNSNSKSTNIDIKLLVNHP